MKLRASDVSGSGRRGALAPMAVRPGPPSVLTQLSVPPSAGWMPRGPTLFHAFLKGVPLLWLLGALTPAAAIVTLRLALTRWPRGILINLVIGSWLLIGAAQVGAALLNGLAMGSLAKGLAASFGFGVTGWVMAALAIAAGAGHHLCDARAVRATAWLGGYILMLSAVAAVARLAGMNSFYIEPTPVSLLLPNSPSVSFYTSVLFFQTEATLGEATTRLVLFFPWTTGLGLGGLAIAFISTLEKDLRWRLIGFSGGMVAIVFSWSRIAIGTFVGVALLLVFFRLPKIFRLAAIGALLCCLFGLVLNDIDPFSAITRARDTAKQARAGSSMARDLIYQKSWDAFLQSPVIGHGWVGESVHRVENLPIGSHSTVYGLLYTGGLPTFLSFVAALSLTFVAVLIRLLGPAHHNGAGHREALVGLALVLSLAAYCPYEALYNLSLPCVFLFTWVGASIGCTRAAATSDQAMAQPHTQDGIRPAPRLRALAPAAAGTLSRALKSRALDATLPSN